ncbi:hypothetical protein [Streptomyces sp. NPDC094049]|uniref:hypothetical protein n=1 Tax=Streptomyces sp. NPDC094049 TaxID=3154987 RepID=UPI00332BA608
MSTLPHDPYATAVMSALGAAGLYDPAASWTGHDCDNGAILLMEAVVVLDSDRAEAAGYEYGATVLWDQLDGWRWGPADRNGQLRRIGSLVSGTVVPVPEDVVRAVRLLLGDEQAVKGLPVAGIARPAATVIPPALQALLDEDVDWSDEETVHSKETLRQLAAYAG